MIDIQTDHDLSILARQLQDEHNAVAAELLKEATINDNFQELVDEAFADPANRKFPIHTPEHTVMSALYMQVQEVDPLVKEACEKALDAWGIEGIPLEIEQPEGIADIPADRFLLPHKKKLPIIDEETLEKSASTLNSYWSQLSMAEKAKAASKLYKIATEEFDVPPEALGEHILRYSLHTPCDLNKLSMSIMDRYEETQNDAYGALLTKISKLKEDIEGSVVYDTGINNDIAIELYEIDKDSGVVGKFDAIYDTFNMPYTKTADDMVKTASPVIEKVDIGGFEISKDELYKISRSDFEEAFPGLSDKVFEGDDLVLEALQEELQYLPKSASYEIGRVLSELQQ